jgi:tRNA modification GTPase
LRELAGSRIARLVTDTIFALSSGALPAAIAIIRISGPRAFEAVQQLAGALPPPRTLSLRNLRSSSGETIDQALVAIFPAPGTATGEPLVELHCHGGRAIVARLLTELAALPGFREANPGEFTRRAVLNSRLDLTEAEGLGDLLSAETEWQRKAASAMAGGRLRRQIDSWRDRLVELAAQAEAAIDYVDEEETELELAPLTAAAGELRSEWQTWLHAPRAELLHQGLRVVLAGPPNAGKSSLFNALVEADKAIVTPIPGTTRDILEAALDLGGIRITLVDTAGVRESTDDVERIGVERARTAAERADILLWLGEASAAPTSGSTLLVASRADEHTDSPSQGAIATSVVTGQGLDKLRKTIHDMATAMVPAPDMLALNRRQATALNEAAAALGLVHLEDALLTAEALRQALHSLDRLTGRHGTEDVLDTLFSRFCLGK